jgi:RNA polymerase sigma-70 factor (ECF subfamily)
MYERGEKLMTDTQIIDLYLQRSESAIDETAKQFGGYCNTIAMNVLHNREDADECVNDAYLKVWNSIPPERPRVFQSFLGKIVRNAALDCYKFRNRQKRGGGETVLLFDELQECISSADNVENAVDIKDLGKAIDDFLRSINRQDAAFFIRRYWYSDSVPKIAKMYSAGESKVKMSLSRTRKKFKDELVQKGVYI